MVFRHGLLRNPGFHLQIFEEKVLFAHDISLDILVRDFFFLGTFLYTRELDFFGHYMEEANAFGDLQRSYVNVFESVALLKSETKKRIILEV